MQTVKSHLALIFNAAMFVFGQSLGAAFIQLVIAVSFELKAARLRMDAVRDEALMLSRTRFWLAVIIVNAVNVTALQIVLRLKPHRMGTKYVLYYPLSYLFLYWITFVLADLAIRVITRRGRTPFIAQVGTEQGFWAFNDFYVRRCATIILLWFLLPFSYIVASDLSSAAKEVSLLAYVFIFLFTYGRVFILR